MVNIFLIFNYFSILQKIFDWVDGQDICFEITRRAAAGFIYSEAVASHYIRQLVQAVQYMHSQNILHRDIRPHNLLLEKLIKFYFLKVFNI